jgi:hypothetical protein
MRGSGSSVLASAEGLNGLHHVSQHLPGQTGVNTNEQAVFHDLVSSCQIADHPEGIGSLSDQVGECGLSHKVATEEHPVTNSGRIQTLHQFPSAKWGCGLDSHHKTEPGTI